jgi:DNA (cytosine-5)-methyltransferase 1
MNKLSLFSGIGGIDLAAKWADMTTVAFCEIEPFCQRVLRKHWPGVPIIEDVRDVTRKELDLLGIGTIDLISAGYPCQPFSVAGKRRGAEDDRHLWSEVARILAEIRPSWFVGENVDGHVTLGLDDVLADLESLDYTAQAFVIPAAAVYASHRRDRVFIVAYAARELSHRCREAWEWRDEYSDSGQIVANSNSIRRDDGCDHRKKRHIQDHINGNAPERESKRDGRIGGASEIGTTMANANSESRLEAYSTACAVGSQGDTWNDAGRSSRPSGAAQPGMGRGVDEFSNWLDGGMNPLDALADFIATYPQPALMGQEQHDWEPPRVATGVKNRAARLKALGNAVDPLQIYPIMYAIKRIDDWLREGKA